MTKYQIVELEVGRDWRRCEDELTLAGVPLPLEHRWAWPSSGTRRLLAALDAGGRCRAALALEERRTRALPGHCTWRVERTGAAAEPEALEATLVALAEMARSDRRVLRADVVIFARDERARGAFGLTLAGLGFERARDPEASPATSCVDLGPSPDELLGRFGTMARRNIRLAEKRPVELRAIHEEAHVAAMEALVRETRLRTGGAPPRRSLAALVELAATHPDLARIVGVFAKDGGRLLAFATGLCHGDHVSYADAASTRDTPVRMPLGYAPVWALMRWAQGVGASWFDFGGITAGSSGDEADPLGGISDFKRMFRGEIVTIADEWTLTPRPRRAAFVAGVTRVAERIRSQA